MAIDELLAGATGFDWDAGNVEKNWHRHMVSAAECEQVFFNRPLVAAADTRHSQNEPRFHALGQTDSQRLLFIAFAVRDTKLRVISARDMSRRERKAYGRYE